MRTEISDVSDSRLEPFVGLRDHAMRQQRERPGGDMAGYFMAEGDLVITRALAAGLELESVLVDGRRSKPLPAEIPDSAHVLIANGEVLEHVAARPRLRDPIGCFVRPPLPSIEELSQQCSTVLVVEGVNNPTNMGVIMRNAAALGVDAVLLDPTACDPLYRRAVRVSMGEVFAVPHARFEQFPAGLGQLDGYRLLALTPSETATSIGELRVGAEDKVALILGAEGPGLTDETLAAVPEHVSIPMAGSVDSINVATAGAVAFYALREARLQG